MKPIKIVFLKPDIKREDGLKKASLRLAYAFYQTGFDTHFLTTASLQAPCAVHRLSMNGKGWVKKFPFFFNPLHQPLFHFERKTVSHLFITLEDTTNIAHSLNIALKNKMTKASATLIRQSVASFDYLQQLQKVIDLCHTNAFT